MDVSLTLKPCCWTFLFTFGGLGRSSLKKKSCVVNLLCGYVCLRVKKIQQAWSVCPFNQEQRLQQRQLEAKAVAPSPPAAAAGVHTYLRTYVRTPQLARIKKFCVVENRSVKPMWMKKKKRQQLYRPFELHMCLVGVVRVGEGRRRRQLRCRCYFERENTSQNGRVGRRSITLEVATKTTTTMQLWTGMVWSFVRLLRLNKSSLSSVCLKFIS